MTKYIRIFIAIIAILSLTVLAKNEVAWAARSSGDGPSLVVEPVQRRENDDCKKRDKNGKCLDKDKDKCNPKKEKCGTVKPPPIKIIIPVTGQYSVGGYCTLSVEFMTENFTLDASINDSVPRSLPKDLYETKRGCLLKYLQADPNGKGQLVTSPMSPDAVTTTICFAATPQQQVQIYFYDVYSASPAWVSLATTVTDGIACATANQSGIYVPTFEAP